MEAEPTSGSQKLCLACGLCCNGVLFADVRLQKDDDAEALQRLGLPVISKGKGWRFAQPCAALEGCRCRIYSERPGYCRAFDCSLLKRVLAGDMERRVALGIITRAREQMTRVTELLKRLGDNDERLPLRQRFRQQAQRLARTKNSEETAALFSELTLVFHELSLLLQESFYPGK
jgi:Fe-S-cluster containining protein